MEDGQLIHTTGASPTLPQPAPPRVPPLRLPLPKPLSPSPPRHPSPVRASRRFARRPTLLRTPPAAITPAEVRDAEVQAKTARDVAAAVEATNRVAADAGAKVRVTWSLWLPYPLYV